MERILISLKYGLLPRIKESFIEELEDDSGMGTIEVISYFLEEKLIK